jgi:hypothetical protein
LMNSSNKKITTATAKAHPYVRKIPPIAEVNCG